MPSTPERMTLREKYEREHREALAARGIIANGCGETDAVARFTPHDHRPLDPWQSLRASAAAWDRAKRAGRGRYV